MDTKSASTFYLGATKLTALYLGSTQVWTAVVPDTTPPTVPTGVTVGTTTATTIPLTWTASTDAVGVAKYLIYVNGNLAGTSTTTSYTCTALTAQTGYTVSVAAQDAAGNTSAQTTPISVTTPAGPDTSPPTTPPNFSVSSTTSNSITVTWGASTDNVAVTSYQLYLNGANTAGVSATTRSYTFPNLNGSTSYSLGIQATDKAGNASTMATISGKTAAAVVYPYTVGTWSSATPLNGSDANGSWTMINSYAVCTVTLDSARRYQIKGYFYCNTSQPYSNGTNAIYNGTYVIAGFTTNNNSVTLPQGRADNAGSSYDQTSGTFYGAGSTTFYIKVTDSYYAGCGGNPGLTITCVA